MSHGVAPLVPLGYGKYVRADRIYALVPLTGEQRGDGRRTLVHVEGIAEPLVASRSEGALVADIARALGSRDAAASGSKDAAAREPSRPEPNQERLL